MPAHRRAPASQRQIDIMLQLWPTDATIPVIAARLTDGRAAGEPHFDKNGVNRLRLQLGLPNRHKPKYDEPMGWRTFNLKEPPLGRLPDEAEVERHFAGRRFEDARVPPPRGRVLLNYSATPYRSSMTLFEGMAA